MNLLSYIVLFSLIGGVFSLIGGIILLLREKLAKRIFIYLISFAAGTLLAAAFLDLLPEAIETGVDPERLFIWSLAGFILFFLIEGLFLRFHYHDEHHLDEKDEHAHHPISNAPWMLLIGDSIHNFLDGVAITAAFLVNIPLGITTALAVAAHEIPQEIGDFTVMLHAGWKKMNVLLLNVGAALMTTAGALIAFGYKDMVEQNAGFLLALTAGFFTYIAASDLIPELYHISHRDKLAKVISLFLIGVIVLLTITRLVE